MSVVKPTCKLKQASVIMPWDLRELGVMYSSEEVMELRQEDQAKIQKLEAYKKMLEEKISKLPSCWLTPQDGTQDQPKRIILMDLPAEEYDESTWKHI